ncbi:hypothetical protein Cgig2_021391 [Carnegiea gigantea]|uniref:Uncharacterized protein n=1 Tax=Carnegiea gigantea TaxID=171969 RepID=A0A9Q1GV10_9CARY|nr:hypothetical protein Cgig2_021391 [Carnegiea gigantea]
MYLVENGWSISFERDRDRYQLIDLVRDANKFLSQPPLDRKPKFFGLSSHSPQKARLKWPINTNDDLLKETSDDFWDYMVGSIDESLVIATASQVNQPSSSQPRKPMLSVILDIPTCTEPIGSICDLTPLQPEDGSHGTDVVVEPEWDCDEGDCDENEFEMADEEQSESEKSDLAFVMDEDGILN